MAAGILASLQKIYMGEVPPEVHCTQGCSWNSSSMVRTMALQKGEFGSLRNAGQPELHLISISAKPC